MSSAEKKLACPLLPAADLLLLNRFNGRLAGEELSPYDIEEYGADYANRLKNLMREGYLQFAEPEEALKYLQVPRLKDILRTNNQKLSGNKSELVSRIIKNIPQGQYAGQLPTIYVVTEQGRFELEKRWAYIENQREMYGFLNSEISALEKQGEGSEQILEKLFARDVIKQSVARNFGMLRNVYYTAHRFFKRRGRLNESITALLTAIYFDLTGMSNGNTVEEYSAKSYVFETRLWSELDKLKTALNLTDQELIKLFEGAAKTAIKPPFSYFEVGTMAEIILERLHGQADLLKRYEKYSKKPRENARDYVYYKIY